MSTPNPDTTQHWHSETDSEGVVWLCFDKADGGANVLSGAVLRELDGHLDALVADALAGVVIYSGKSNGFIMGADINEFPKIETAEQGYELIRLGQQVINRLADLSAPTVAVINGFALGGGLEFAMACDYRLALENPKPVLGLPEVQLGVHPGFGGTVRAVQLAGVRAAMQLMLTGKPVTVSKGKRIGLVDRIVGADDWRGEASRIVRERPPLRKAPLADRLLSLAPIRPFIAKTLVKQVSGKARRDHYPAPYAMIDLWRAHGASPTAGFEAEARSFASLVVGPTARNLVRVFFLQNQLKAQGGKQKNTIARVHVIGAGVMGGDIAAWCALRGMQVTLQDREMQYIAPALERAQKLFAKKARGSEKKLAETEARLRPDVSGAGAAEADLIIEAIFEDLDAKQALYKKVQRDMKPGAILATNTSSIRLEELRTVLDSPTQFVGLHFFNPVAQLPLVEVIRCDDTDEEILARAFAFVKAIAKNPLGCTSSPGFVVNRVLAPYMAEAMHLVADGVALRDIDSAAEDFGMPMGPVELADSVGLDVALGVSGVMSKAFGREIPDGLEAKVAAGELGRKSGQGFFRWVDGKAVKPESGAGSRGDADDIADRLILLMVNEAVACLSEGVVESPDLLDAGVIFGTGFAPFRGGPLQYARDRGVDAVVERLRALAGELGPRFEPHAGWDSLRA